MNPKMFFAVATITVALAAPAFAQNASQQQRQQSTSPRHDVYKNGQYLGSDPDPHVRASIQRGNGAAGLW